MLINAPLRLLALLTLFIASGCSHLPSLGSINLFSADSAFADPDPDPDPDEVIVVESVPVGVAVAQTEQMTPQVSVARVSPGTKETVGAEVVQRGNELGDELGNEPVDLLANTTPQPTVEANSETLAGLGILADSRKVLTPPLQNQNANPTLNQNYAARAVALGDTEGVMDLPPTYWAVQIAAVKDIERVAKMVKDNRLQGMLGVPMNTESGPLHAVLAGVFVNREDALASAENLPPALAGYEPWVRPLAHLQAAMR